MRRGLHARARLVMLKFRTHLRSLWGVARSRVLGRDVFGCIRKHMYSSFEGACQWACEVDTFIKRPLPPESLDMFQGFSFWGWGMPRNN